MSVNGSAVTGDIGFQVHDQQVNTTNFTCARIRSRLYGLGRAPTDEGLHSPVTALDTSLIILNTTYKSMAYLRK
jgi:hypothetical protein